MDRQIHVQNGKTTESEYRIIIQQSIEITISLIIILNVIRSEEILNRYDFRF